MGAPPTLAKPVEGDELALRPLTSADAGRFAAIITRPECTAFSDIPDGMTRKQSDGFVARMLKLDEKQAGAAWTIWVPDVQTFVGCIRLNKYVARSGQATIGYEIDPDHWGNGIATRAVQVLTRHSHSALSAHRIEAWTLPENMASTRVLEKSGYTFEGTLRGKGFFKGRHHDMRIYGRVASDPMP